MSTLATLERLPPLGPLKDIDTTPLLAFRIPDLTCDDAHHVHTIPSTWPQCIVDPSEWPHMDPTEKLLQRAHAIRARNRLLPWLSCLRPPKPLLLTQDQAVALVTALCWLPPPHTWPGIDHSAAEACERYLGAVCGFLALTEALDAHGVYPD